MERLQQLISKLKEQFDQKADASQMLATTQQIEAELVHTSRIKSTRTSTAKVAVVMPTSMKFSAPQTETAAEPVFSLPVVAEEPEGRETNMLEEVNGSSYYQPQETKIIRREEPSKWQYDPLTEIPTLSHQQNGKEINDVIGNNGTSLNDRLKANHAEVAHSLKDLPVRDLKKAIGVNDRFLFINELFRGDEAMYERSIKTINNFRILPEAEYWMERELKVKLGWDESRDTTQHFYQVVKRRFS